MTELSKKICFIINPISGGGKGIRVRSFLETSDLLKNFEITFHTTTKAGDAIDFTKKAIENQVDIVVAVGGDGTVNEVGSTLIGSNTALAIIPAGSGNGLARHLNISRNIKKAIELLKNAEVKVIDTATLNGKSFINVAGTGLDAIVSKQFASTKKRGWFNYLKIMLKAGSFIKEKQFHLKYNGTKRSVKAYMITTANSSQFGNNARIAPFADIEDGKIDICIMNGTGLFQNFISLCKLMSGSLKNGKYYETFQSSEIEIENTDSWTHVDGEPYEISGPMHVKVNPKSLKVIC